jgi:hypothetical protein
MTTYVTSWQSVQTFVLSFIHPFLQFSLFGSVTNRIMFKGCLNSELISYSYLYSSILIFVLTYFIFLHSPDFILVRIISK